MRYAWLYLKKSLAGSAVLLLLLFYPASAFAAVTTTDTTQTGPTSSTGPQQPPGADGKTYHFNETTGLWENDYYTWNPTTGQTTPKTPQNYSYNPTTGMWDTTQYRYDAPSGTYVPNVVSQTSDPNPAPQTSTVSPQSVATDTTNTAAPAPNTVVDNPTNHIFDSFYNAGISNQVTSTAQTGDASVISNTLAGNAISGDALALSNIINILQSSLSPNNGQLTTFTSNIQGNVVGDLIIDPSQFPNSQLPTTEASTPSNLQINSQSNGQITNNVALNATSGNINVENNTQAGNATSGSANAVANVVNLMNSAVNANQSFLGVVNIWGSLEGDILLPPGLLTSLLASNGASTVATTTNADGTVNAAFADAQVINNNVTSTAHTGVATVSGNTSAGNAISGNAANNVTLLNFTGHNVIGSDALLVFVNVLGRWVGFIVNAPSGSTAAALGGGISSDTSQAQCPCDTSVNSTNNGQINNNISVNANSGNALVNNNTQAGNATTGNATTSVNLANIINSNLALSRWFGVLFINVFGSWNGSFGVNTPLGNPVGPSLAASSAASNNTNQSAQVFRFVPTSSASNNNSTYRVEPVALDNTQNQDNEDSNQKAVVLGTSDSHTTPTANPYNYSWLFAVLIGSALLGTERVTDVHKKRRRTPILFTKKGSIEFIEPLKTP